MKKFLLSLAALCSVCGAVNAETVVDLDQNYKGMTEFPYYVMDFKPEVVDGNLVVTNEEAKGFWEVQYFLCYDFAVEEGVEYTVTANIKSDVAGDITVVMGNWGENTTGKLHIEANNEWTEYSTKISNVPVNEEGKSFLIFQSGEMVGTYYVEWVKVTHEKGEGPVTPPSGEEVVVMSQDYKDMTEFPYYVMDFKPEVVDGNLVVTNEEAKGFWEVQYFLCYDFAVEEGVEYTVKANIKSDVAGDITVVMGNWGENKTCKLHVEANNEWTEYSAKMGTVPVNDEGKSFLIFQSGEMVGTYSVEWVKVTKPGDSGVQTVAGPVAERTVVYNLMGVKVLDVEGKADLNSLGKGIYIVNGKKVAVK